MKKAIIIFLLSMSIVVPVLAYQSETNRSEIQSKVRFAPLHIYLDSGNKPLAAYQFELKAAVGQERKAEEFGDLLFTLVNVARRMGVDSEAALREANRRFYRRFSFMEELCRQRGLTFGELSFDEQNALWEEASEQVEKEGFYQTTRIGRQAHTPSFIVMSETSKILAEFEKDFGLTGRQKLPAKEELLIDF